MQLCVQFGNDKISITEDRCELIADRSTTECRRVELQEGPVRGLQFYVDGFTVLHGSCIEFRDKAVSIVGRSGAGKSTLATVLCQRGGRLISDGMTVIRPDTLDVIPGAARTKLTEDSIRLLGQTPEQFDLVHRNSVKRYFPVPGVGPTTLNERLESLRKTPRRIHLVLVVEDANEIAIEPIVGAKSLISLIANAYLADYLPTEHAGILMQRAATLLSNGVQVKALRRRKEPGELTRIAENIENEVRALR